MLKEAKDRRLYSSVPEQLLSRVSWVIRSSNRRKVAEGELECGRLRLVGDLNPSDDGECVAQWDSGSSALELRREASCITIPSRYLGTLKAAGGDLLHRNRAGNRSLSNLPAGVPLIG